METGRSTILAYIDESGDAGARGSQTFTLGCVLVKADRWASTFDDLVEYRRWLKRTFGIPVRAEIKANYLLRGGGPVFRKIRLGEPLRHKIYRGLMRLQGKLALQTFAVVIRKNLLQGGSDPRGIAWTYLLQRVERLETETLIVHDEGEGHIVRALCRKARRAGSAGSRFGTGALTRPARLLLDDPVPRQSDQSYFLQFADLAAYAAFRHVYPPPPRHVQIVPANMWLELGAAMYAPANKLKGGTPGIVVWP